MENTLTNTTTTTSAMSTSTTPTTNLTLSPTASHSHLKPPPRTPHALSHNQHILQNTLLILLSIFFLPFTTLLVLLPNLYIHPCPPPQFRNHGQETVLITNTTMTKGLTLCRAFKKCGWRVIGADIIHESSGGQKSGSAGMGVVKKVFGWVQWSPGRLSRAVDRYCEFPDPAGHGVVCVEEENKIEDGKSSIKTTMHGATDMGEHPIPSSPDDLSPSPDPNILIPKKGKQKYVSAPHHPKSYSEAAASTPSGASSHHHNHQHVQPKHSMATTPAIDAYAAAILKLFREEKVQLWIHVSSVASTVEESQAATIVENTLREEQEKNDGMNMTMTKIMQLPPAICSILHEKDTFIEFTKSLGFRVPLSLVCKSEAEVMDFFYPADAEKSKMEDLMKKKFILKCIPLDDVARADLTLYPFPTKAATHKAISKLKISPEKPFLLQEFIEGEEYTTHGVISDGKLMSFTACPSSELLMHYLPMDTHSAEFKAMRAFTEEYISAMSQHGIEGAEHMSGQMSFDFLVKRNEETDEVELYPIECNPRTHTAVVLFSHDPRSIANAYLGHYPSDSERVSPTPKGQQAGYYWVGHDLVTLVLLPFAEMVVDPVNKWRGFFEGVGEFMNHVLWWKDPMFETWDPAPWWWMYHVYWPGVFLGCLLTGRKWSRVNVSTGRVFESD